jgi:hypothetical protein
VSDFRCTVASDGSDGGKDGSSVEHEVKNNTIEAMAIILTSVATTARSEAERKKNLFIINVFKGLKNFSNTETQSYRVFSFCVSVSPLQLKRGWG